MFIYKYIHTPTYKAMHTWTYINKEKFDLLNLIPTNH